jgi:hypothetical protein
MSIRLGTTNASLYLGSTPVAAYLGAQQVYSASTPAALLLNFNGANESNTFTDSSPNGLTVTANGDAQISTAQSKFGGASGLLNGTDAFLEIPYNEALHLAAENFTVEFWFRASVTSNQDILNLNSDVTPSSYAAMRVCIESGALRVYFAGSGGSSWLPSGSQFIDGPAVSADQWYHAAIVRSGDVVTLYVDGVQSGQETFGTAGYSLYPFGGVTRIGNIFFSFNILFSGYIDDLRIVKGKAVYTANFTPPAAQLGPDA